MTQPFELNSDLDRDELKARFRSRQRLEIGNFLRGGGAEALRAHLLSRDDWRLVLNAGDKVYELTRAAVAALSEEQRLELETRVNAAARKGFQYRYETVRVSDSDAERSERGTLLERFVQFMSSSPVLDLVGDILGDDDLAFADGQATSYGPGHFLTRHDDDVEGKHRRAAYVFGLQPGWLADWGGLLMFHAADGNIEEAFTPAMGALRVFRVPAPHSVSSVASFAPEARLSVTGWFRSQRP